jgi:hypothetical protein
MDQSLFAAPHGLSQRITSFIACACQGIHQLPLFHLIVLIANDHQDRQSDPICLVLTRWSRSGRAGKRLPTAVRPCGALRLRRSSPTTGSDRSEEQNTLAHSISARIRIRAIRPASRDMRNDVRSATSTSRPPDRAKPETAKRPMTGNAQCPG